MSEAWPEGSLFAHRDEIAEAKRLRDTGLAQVEANQPEEWSVRCRALAERFIAAQPGGAEFTGEDVRLFCIEQGIDQPNHPNAWGAVVGRVLRRALAGDISAVGLKRTTTASAHRRATVLYRKRA